MVADIACWNRCFKRAPSVKCGRSGTRSFGTYVVLSSAAPTRLIPSIGHCECCRVSDWPLAAPTSSLTTSPPPHDMHVQATCRRCCDPERHLSLLERRHTAGLIPGKGRIDTTTVCPSTIGCCGCCVRCVCANPAVRPAYAHTDSSAWVLLGWTASVVRVHVRQVCFQNVRTLNVIITLPCGGAIRC